MPVEVTKYTCEFQCGKRATGNKTNMMRHESACWKNPENKTCKTCTNEIYESDHDGYVSVIHRGCKLSALDKILTDAHEVMAYQNTAHVRPIYHCRYWCGEEDAYTPVFEKILFEEIIGKEEGTEHYPFYNKPVKTETKDLF